MSRLGNLIGTVRGYFNPERPNRPLEQTFDREQTRVRERRARLGTAEQGAPGFGLALSGGGIRSATFALGVLQGLARARAPDHLEADPVQHPEKSLLARFDYLSTVSGGGYVGAFFGSLFVPGRLWRGSDAENAAADAYRVLQHEPPGRIRWNDEYSREGVRRSATGWLRENGRYLTPTGAGDLIYALALAIRNWFSVQYVLGTFIALAFALVLFARFGLANIWAPYGELEQWLLEHAAACGEKCTSIWWSPFVAVPVVLLALWLVPLGLAFWLTYPGASEDERAKPRVFSLAALAALFVSLASFLIGEVARSSHAPPQHIYAPVAGGAIALLGFVYHAASSFFAEAIGAHRVVMTRWLATGFKVLLAVLAVAAIDTFAQSLYLAWVRNRGIGAVASPAAFVAGAVWLFRQLAGLADRGGVPSVLKKIPVGVLAGVAGVALFVAIACLWGLVIHEVIWIGMEPVRDAFAAGAAAQAKLLAVCVGVSLTLAVIVGHFSAFLNLSTLQSFYSARLTRAYLGGSNGMRFEPDADANLRRELSAAEPAAGDQLGREDYYASLAPLHVINVTVNQTVDPAEQLVQRDRKGRPMAVLPTGFSIDRMHYDFRDSEKRGVGSGLGSERLTIGQWIGTSGAAFTTGLGRSTSLGTSIALGLANVRLGTWWSSGHGDDTSGWLGRAFKALFKTQVFLFYELMAKFYGLRREWQYLSDGGHFENTALYELVRPGRGLELIVVCDDGCDEHYSFADLANLSRLARIDHGLQIEIDEEIAKHDVLGKVFATPQHFARGGAAARSADDRCALLLNVYRADDASSARVPHCRIVLLKPTMIDAAPVDVLEYATSHPAFPQEPTTDQFFDEAQWESYRSLGLCIARRVFGEESDGGVGAAFWRYLTA